MYRETSQDASRLVVGLSALTALLALIAAGAGLLWPGGEGPFSFTTLRGETAEMFGRGLYRHDTLFVGAGSRGTDVVTLVLGLPLLAFTTWWYRRGSLRGALLLTGTFAYFLYVYASFALGTVAYNEFFLVYVVLFSTSLYAFLLTFTETYRHIRSAEVSAHLPRRGPALFMFASGIVTLVVWLTPLVVALIQGHVPERLDSYTTKVTEALDLAIITPATFISGMLILRRAPLGYLMAMAMLVLETLLFPMIAAQTVSQVMAGVSFPPGQIVGPIAGFATLGLLALWVMIVILRPLPDSTPSK